MATAMLDHVDHFFGLPTDLFCIGCFIAELGAGEAEGSWCWFEIVRVYIYKRDSKNLSRKRRLLCGGEGRGLSVTLIRAFFFLTH